MSHKEAFEALDRTLTDIRENIIFGGTPLVIAGDFRQTLPVIPRSIPADELHACLKGSYLWQLVEKLHLSTNMRVHLHNDTTADSIDGQITFPAEFGHNVETGDDLKDKVHPNIIHHFTNKKWLCERAILASRNDKVEAINMSLLNKLPGLNITYKSIDTVVEQDDAVQYPTEFLNSLQPPGLPPHSSSLKIGAPIMLIRNLDAPKLCNGTRLAVKSMIPHVHEATILTGPATGEDVLIPESHSSL
ncbi:hypothetical protein LOD99_2237 [Oopsacas minuta]|uniref:ATP-dependent DNA helicase n=1 Tax=Oopsacas minuta TaxID=111878 RepID=A0AAV7K2D8_9METZ|nr:hypothetical protein LOD99_2237 [Oopsacas minuta]